MLDELETELSRSRRYRHPLTVLMIDLDWFKEINDTCGHLVGDRVLKRLGELLRDEARTMDVVARYGGEEFTIILPDTGIEGGIIFAERLRQRAERHDYAEDGDPLHVTVSVGVATYQDGTVTAEEMIASADAALYRAKKGGRNRVHQ
jgi:diguanylate cyclase (GGDEF)-like protein